jgi:hypothetical protein
VLCSSTTSRYFDDHDAENLMMNGTQQKSKRDNYVRMYTHTYICMYACMYSILAYICMFCMYVCMYVCMSFLYAYED